MIFKYDYAPFGHDRRGFNEADIIDVSVDRVRIERYLSRIFDVREAVILSSRVIFFPHCIILAGNWPKCTRESSQEPEP